MLKILTPLIFLTVLSNTSFADVEQICGKLVIRCFCTNGERTEYLIGKNRLLPVDESTTQELNQLKDQQICVHGERTEYGLQVFAIEVLGPAPAMSELAELAQ